MSPAQCWDACLLVLMRTGMTLLMKSQSRQEKASHESPRGEGPTPQPSLSSWCLPTSPPAAPGASHNPCRSFWYRPGYHGSTSLVSRDEAAISSVHSMILFLFHTSFGYLADSNTNSLLKLLLFSLPPGTQQMQMQALGHSPAPVLDCVLAFVSPG